MANLSWPDVVWIGVVGCLGFTLLSYWFSGVMNRRNWSWQVKPKKPVAKAPVAGAPNEAQAGSRAPREG